MMNRFLNLPGRKGDVRREGRSILAIGLQSAWNLHPRHSGLGHAREEHPANIARYSRRRHNALLAFEGGGSNAERKNG